jgi:hypothetical protein
MSACAPRGQYSIAAHDNGWHHFFGSVEKRGPGPTSGRVDVYGKTYTGSLVLEEAGRVVLRADDGSSIDCNVGPRQVNDFTTGTCSVNGQEVFSYGSTWHWVELPPFQLGLITPRTPATHYGSFNASNLEMRLQVDGVWFSGKLNGGFDAQGVSGVLRSDGPGTITCSLSVTPTGRGTGWCSPAPGITFLVSWRDVKWSSGS